MDNSKFKLLLAEYRHRELPTNYELLAPAAEVATLLREHALDKQEWERDLVGREKARDGLLAELTSTAYLLDEAVSRFQEPLEEKGLKRMHRELRVLKDKLVQILQEAEYTWRDPLGERFEGDLPELVNVDGWRYGPDYEEERVVQVREPIILRGGEPIKEGSVVVGAPDIETISPVGSMEPTQDVQAPPKTSAPSDGKPDQDVAEIE